MYNNIHSDFPFAQDHDPRKQLKLNEFVPNGPYRTSTAFNAFSNERARQPTLPASNNSFLRDTSNFAHNYPLDGFASAQPLSSPPQQPASSSFDALHQPRGGYDFVSAQPPPGIGAPHNKPLFSPVDPFGQGHKSNSLLSGPGAQQQQSQLQQPQSQHNGFPGGVFPNGLHHQQMQSQTPYGPHLPASASAPAVTQQNPAATANQAMQAPTGQEEISTIFVVGFPEDMQEREFQNMFTFSSGFEAATLKIPNKELTAYGSGVVGPGGGSLRSGGPLGYTHGGANDPYNLVTINQGGVVVDGGRDGTTSSWQPTDDPHFSHLVPNGPGGANGANNGMSTRKQIIGFAKFRSRAEALEARDTLQGRRVDIEKGAVLKAEMAKKNLHTKRGIGPLPLQLSSIMGAGGGTVPPEALAGLPGINNLGGLGSPQGLGAPGETLSARERELGTLGAMGLRRDSRIDQRDEELDTRKAGVIGGFGSVGTRGARERAEEEDRKWKEKQDAERNARLRSTDAFTYDAFHSVPQNQRPLGNSLLAATQGETERANGFVPRSNAAPPWGVGQREAALSTALRKMSVPLPPGLPQRPPSQQQSQQPSSQSSPPNREAAAFTPGMTIGTFSPPQLGNQALPSHPSLPSRPRAYSPTGQGEGSIPMSSGSSVADSHSSIEEELCKPLGSLAVSTAPSPGAPTGTGTTSPQLPSPASGASSGGSARSGAVDQNPPINTLYVGNLPSSPPPPGYAATYLEDSLRELFARRPGYRKLCFRQKSNGPMCFVEFIDVHHATKALNDLYGATLGGLVKGGGIRVSYSKNPLGVRTPTNAANGASQQPPAGLTSSGATFPAEAFGQPRAQDLEFRGRSDTSGVTSPVTAGYQYSVSPPPPRFVSPPPSNPSTFNPTILPRQNNNGGQSFGFSPTTISMASPSPFSPFGISPSPHPSNGTSSSNQFSPIPEQTTHNNMNISSSNNGNHHITSDSIEHSSSAVSTLAQNNA
ncbi:hypothetical protein FA95DRAFT_663428 [Auriscalpium vulgare]|uniref:Uncharacterized protein n=1 Tax=Auriscalpium vulgare TaxID=40419 RepID=A0ACB8S2K3_9AGAM|nr:hypothetical protein FA95DRAFT_663428 [Auriscalpium vulgare]